MDRIPPDVVLHVVVPSAAYGAGVCFARRDWHEAAMGAYPPDYAYYFAVVASLRLYLAGCGLWAHTWVVRTKGPRLLDLSPAARPQQGCEGEGLVTGGKYPKWPGLTESEAVLGIIPEKLGGDETVPPEIPEGAVELCGMHNGLVADLGAIAEVGAQHARNIMDPWAPAHFTVSFRPFVPDCDKLPRPRKTPPVKVYDEEATADAIANSIIKRHTPLEPSAICLCSPAAFAVSIPADNLGEAVMQRFDGMRAEFAAIRAASDTARVHITEPMALPPRIQLASDPKESEEKYVKTNLEWDWHEWAKAAVMLDSDSDSGFGSDPDSD